MADDNAQEPKKLELGHGVSEADLLTAVRASGYPFQSRVVDQVVAALKVEGISVSAQEEWSPVLSIRARWSKSPAF
jgi:hypothetical protein